jgi:hypothetical protein
LELFVSDNGTLGDGGRGRGSSPWILSSIREGIGIRRTSSSVKGSVGVTFDGSLMLFENHAAAKPAIQGASVGEGQRERKVESLPIEDNGIFDIVARVAHHKEGGILAARNLSKEKINESQGQEGGDPHDRN